jgi:hypothetical protein
MSFTFSQARKLSPEETNPYNALLSRALDTFQKGVGAAYLPREKEAKIGQMQASSQKNLLLMKLLSSVMKEVLLVLIANRLILEIIEKRLLLKP